MFLFIHLYMYVSLLIATYNWKEALSLSVQSVFSQTVLPNEILIADDGSVDDTRRMIEVLQQQSPIPIIHIWHEDNGFRLTTIRNKAIAAAKGDYIIQIDGDTLLEKHFIEDHIGAAEFDYFVCGSRVKLDAVVTANILKSKKYSFNCFRQNIGSVFNGFRSKILRKFLAKRYGKDIAHLRGCNMAFWKKDLIEVNGYNEQLTSWGHEDAELAYRLHFAGKKKKSLKMGGILFHLYHKEHTVPNEKHLEMIKQLNELKSSWCENGLNKYYHN